MLPPGQGRNLRTMLGLSAAAILFLAVASFGICLGIGLPVLLQGGVAVVPLVVAGAVAAPALAATGVLTMGARARIVRDTIVETHVVVRKSRTARWLFGAVLGAVALVVVVAAVLHGVLHVRFAEMWAGAGLLALVPITITLHTTCGRLHRLAQFVRSTESSGTGGP